MQNFLRTILKVDSLLLLTSVLLTIMSQHPHLLENGIGRLFFLVWALPLLRMLTMKRFLLDKVLLIPLAIYFLLLMFLLLAIAFLGDEYLHIPNFNNISMMLAIMLVGYYLAYNISENEFIILIFWSCLIGGIVLSYGIYASSFTSNYDIMSRSYAYLSKNSASHIVFSCFIFILLLPSSTKISFVKYPALLFMGYTIILMKSRATILAFVVLIVLIFLKSNDRKLKLYTMLILLVGIVAIIYFENLSSIFTEGVLLGGRDVNDIEDISSGRMSMISSFPVLIQNNLFFGRGYYFIESFPLSTIVQVGIIGSTIIFSLLFWVVGSVNTRFTASNPLDLSIIILFYSLMLNSLFEEQTPFGPGTKSFLFWLSFGFVLCKRRFSRNYTLRIRK